MTTFEVLALLFYAAFASAYMAIVLGINEVNSDWLRLIIFFVALTFGQVWFPITFAIDIYNKLHK